MLGIHLSCFSLRTCIVHVPCSCSGLTGKNPLCITGWAGLQTWQSGLIGAWSWSVAGVFRSHQVPHGEPVFIHPHFHAISSGHTSFVPFRLHFVILPVCQFSHHFYYDFQHRDNFYLSGLHISPISLTVRVFQHWLRDVHVSLN